MYDNLCDKKNLCDQYTHCVINLHTQTHSICVTKQKCDNFSVYFEHFNKKCLEPHKKKSLKQANAEEKCQGTN